MLRILATGQTCRWEDLHHFFPNVSFPHKKDNSTLELFGIVEEPDPEPVEPTPEELALRAAQALESAKKHKNAQINSWRAAANQTHFTHLGKQIACDPLSRSDIDAVANNIALTGTFPVGFPNAWKAMDNTFLPISTIDAFKELYASMTLQGALNFAKSQDLKAQVETATTISAVQDITW